MDSDIWRGIDRISKLPDSLLCHILSFLSTKNAVGTSILSTRWKYVWTTVPNLDFDESELFQEYVLSEHTQEEEDLRFQRFVNRVLLLTDAPCFQKFHLKGYLGLHDHVDAWISAAIKRNVQDLALWNLNEVPIELPRMLFTSKTLVVLKLSGVCLSVPHSVWLPRLKILNLDTLEYENGDTMQNLLSGCPVLENLHIQKSVRDTHSILNISVPTLTCLAVICLRDALDESDGPGCKLVVNTPQLQCFCLIDFVSEDFLLGNLYSLSKASVTFGPTRNSFIGDGLPGYKLLSRIPNVKFLDVCLHFDNDVNDYLLPTFHNLTQLKFSGSLNAKLFADLLQCSPNLEVLIFQGSSCGAVKSWNPPDQVPSCLISHLKKIQLEECCGKDYVLGMVKYLLKNAKVLEKMTIECHFLGKCSCGELATFSRGSKSCQFNLLLCSCLKS